MKRVLLLGMVVTGLLTACQPAPINTTNPEQTPDRVYKINARVSSFSVVEFTPEGYPNKTCIHAEGSSFNSGLACFDK